MKINHKNIPQTIKDIPQWGGWKFAPNPSNPNKPKKIPINPKTGNVASVSNPKDWGSFERAKRRLDKGNVDGIGFLFTEDDPYVGIDLDKCRNKKTGKIKSWAQKIIDDFNSYTEVSPSGTGIHIIVKGSLPGKGRKVGDIEIYDKKRYFTFTGKVV